MATTTIYLQFLKFSFSRRREGKEKEEENGRWRDERNNHARATTCVAMSLNDWRLLENRSTSIHLEARLSCAYYTTSHRRAIYMWTYSRYIHMHRARAGFCTIVEMPPFTKLKLYRGKSILQCLVLNSGSHVFMRLNLASS